MSALSVIAANAQKELRQQLNWLRQKEAQLREEKLLLLIKDVSEQPSLQAPGACQAWICTHRLGCGGAIVATGFVPKMSCFFGLACHTSQRAHDTPRSSLILARCGLPKLNNLGVVSSFLGTSQRCVVAPPTRPMDSSSNSDNVSSSSRASL